MCTLGARATEQAPLPGRVEQRARVAACSNRWLRRSLRLAPHIKHDSRAA